MNVPFYGATALYQDVVLCGGETTIVFVSMRTSGVGPVAKLTNEKAPHIASGNQNLPL